MGCVLNQDAAPDKPALLGLPGLIKLQQIYDYTPGADDRGNIKVQNTFFLDMASLAGLACSPRYLYLVNNSQLSTLSGLEALSYPDPSLNFSMAVTGSALRGPQSVQALRNVAGCPSGCASSLPRYMNVETDGCNMLVRTSSFLASSLATSAFKLTTDMPILFRKLIASWSSQLPTLVLPCKLQPLT